MATYEIFKVGERESKIAEFSTAADAGVCVKDLQAKTGAKYRIHFAYTYDDLHTARWRERDRFLFPEDVPPPYKRLPEWVPTIGSHYVHMALDEKRRAQGWVAYSPDERHLIEDKQLTLPLSKYLAKYFSEDYAPEDIARITTRYLGSFAPTTFTIVKDRALLHKAYIGTKHCAESSTYESCMHYDHREYNLPPGDHPVDAYFFDDVESSDFALAYTERDGEIVARAMVLPANKIFVRVYGDGEVERDDIINHLKAAGYKKARSFAGALLCLRPHPNEDDGAVIMPYLDGSDQYCTADGLIVDGNDERARYNCETTEGFTYPFDRARHNNNEGDEDYEEQPRTFFCEHRQEEVSYESAYDMMVVIPQDAEFNTYQVQSWSSEFLDELVYISYDPTGNRFGHYMPRDNEYVVAWCVGQAERELAERQAREAEMARWQNETLTLVAAPDNATPVYEWTNET
jgi:hypothetical protein